jgi:VWFA-related protein
MRNKIGFALMFLLIGLAFTSAQEKKDAVDSEGSSVTLKATTHMVVLDVVVTNSNGHHAKDLQRDDFTVTEDGVTQKVVSFEASGKHKAFSQQPKGNLNDMATGTDAASGTPQTILVLDELDTEWLLTAQARWYLNRYFAAHGPRLEQPTALLALTNEGLEMLCDYTHDVRTLAVSLNRHKTALPYHVMNAEGVRGAFDRLGIAMTALYQIAQASTDRHNRKNLVWIGEGFPVLNGATTSTLGSAGVRGGTIDSATEAKARQMIQRLANSLLEARISVYTVDPVGLIYTPNLNDPRVLTTKGDLIFENIAPETGGQIFRNLNDVGFLVDKSVSDGSSYYTLAYYPSDHNWNGKFRQIKLTVNRPGLTARTRQGYYAFAEPEETPDEQIDLALSIAVRNPIPYTLIPLTLSAKRLDNLPRASELTVSLDRNALYWTKLSNGDLRAEITLVTASLRDDNRVLKYKVREFESVVSKQKAASLRNLPLVFTVQAEVPPKSVRIRCIVRDAQNEHIGTADLATNETQSIVKAQGSPE